MIERQAFDSMVVMVRHLTGWRHGQTVWNVALSIAPHMHRWAGTNIDPFYNDSRVDAFIGKLVEECVIVS